MAFTLEDVRSRTYKARDAWWTVLLVDPLASRLVKFTANRTGITPNQLTTGALLLGLGAGACFATAESTWLLVGALLYHLSFVLDCMDGKIARLKGTGSVFGAWLDYIFDRVRVLACSIALMGGLYAATGNVAFVWTGLAVVFLDMLRYLDALEIYKVRSQMRSRLVKAQTRAAELELATRRLPSESEMDSMLGGDYDKLISELPKPHELMQQGFHKRFPWYARVRNGLLRGRIRPHLISGIEFQMSVFIIAPVLAVLIGPTAVIWTAALAGAGLLFFELVIIYKFYLSSLDFARVSAELEAKIAEYEAQLPAESEVPLGRAV
ncbi:MULTISPECIES: CDP-alcohol phosphatidyltransferase family protein [Thermomonospora]|uniref:CDP-alcohol phosphatidyltransferase n=1 Tax=Thermomonospora curvata (strain ATCC 19995 / DSM 43183 / JCM 3096 / KCTC 9072 / NBRC 15933 / NCIMB 10081 / Henssen B9) TaxID=471852 RepID=D1AF83_THECD|nr:MULTISPECIES: CDP-alcohol phosphatidyltransferase family protein [Thermomonospora]ACY99627.1 CDP-alcohol phosphatidyltransferase [Thermomonospora curvata DSM 43183]PKK12928.1 MAG: CDP-alcohol phosphatidyltransferase family protein [Thermomonospora sp. CIF 1]